MYYVRNIIVFLQIVVNGVPGESFGSIPDPAILNMMPKP